MYKDSDTARYVIGPEKPVSSRPTGRVRPRRDPAPPLPVPPPSTLECWPLAAVLCVAGLVVIAFILGHELHEARETGAGETQRADQAMLQAEKLQGRLFKLAAEYDRLADDRRGLLRQTIAATAGESDARAVAKQALLASAAAKDETMQVAARWSDYSSNLAQTLDSERDHSVALEGELKAERQSAAEQAGQLNLQIQRLAGDKESIEQEAAAFQRLARELDSTVGSLRQQVGRLESERSSLESENRSLSSEVNCLKGTVSSLSAEVSSLRCEISNLRR